MERKDRRLHVLPCQLPLLPCQPLPLLPCQLLPLFQFPVQALHVSPLATAMHTRGARKPSMWNGAICRIHVLHHFARQPARHPHLRQHRCRCLVLLLLPPPLLFLPTEGVVFLPWSTTILLCMESFARHRSRQTYAWVRFVSGRQALRKDLSRGIVSWAWRSSRARL